MRSPTKNLDQRDYIPEINCFHLRNIIPRDIIIEKLFLSAQPGKAQKIKHALKSR